MPAIAFDRFYRHADLSAILAAIAAERPDLVAAEADALGEGHWRVRLVVQSTGWLPSYVSKRALERKVVRGVIAEIALPEGATLVHGKRRAELG
jgi:hypothetical protein